MLTLSIYTILFSRIGKYFLYNARSNFFSEISIELYDALMTQTWNALPDDVVDFLISKELVCKNEDRYNYYYSQLLTFNKINNDCTRMSLVLVPTTACNFDCPYCFESKKNPKFIDSQTIKQLSDFIKRRKEVKSINLTWYGGEPLLAFDRIKEIIKELSSEGMPKIESQSIITNGYCFNDEIVSFFKANRCAHIQITIDGLYEKHSLTRCLKNSKKDTFQPIVSNIDKLVDELEKTRINIRVNINKNNYSEFIKVANFFKERYPDNKMIGVYPGIIREENEDKHTLCESSFSTSEMLVLNELLRKGGYDTSDFPEKNFRGCMMHNTNSFLIGPEGEIYKCWSDIGNPNTIIGNIKQNELTNPSRYIKYSVQAIPFNDECKECHAFPICNGGCAYFRYRNMFEDGRFDLCSPYKDKEKLIDALLSGELDI